MPRTPSFKPVKTDDAKLPWMLNIPPSVSKTGKRKREFFRTRLNAESRARVLRKMWVSSRVNDDILDLLKPLNATVEDAVAFYVAHHEQKSSAKFQDAWLAYLTSKTRREGAARDFREILSMIDGEFDDRLVSSITGVEIENMADARNFTPHMYARFRSYMRAFFNFCLRKEWVASNPAMRLDPPNIPAKEIETLSVEEAAALLECCDSDALPYFAIGMFAGVRPMEMRRMDWSCVDWDHRDIKVSRNTSKVVGRQRHVLMSDNLFDWLEPWRDASGPIAPANIIKKRRHAWRAAGMKRWPQDVLRHTFASNHLAMHEDINKLMLAMGHTGNTGVLFNHYHRAIPRRRAERFWAIRPRRVQQ